MEINSERMRQTIEKTRNRECLHMKTNSEHKQRIKGNGGFRKINAIYVQNIEHRGVKSKNGQFLQNLGRRSCNSLRCYDANGATF